MIDDYGYYSSANNAVLTIINTITERQPELELGRILEFIRELAPIFMPTLSIGFSSSNYCVNSMLSFISSHFKSEQKFLKAFRASRLLLLSTGE